MEPVLEEWQLNQPIRTPRPGGGFRRATFQGSLHRCPDSPPSVGQYVHSNLTSRKIVLLLTDVVVGWKAGRPDNRAHSPAPQASSSDVRTSLFWRMSGRRTRCFGRVDLSSKRARAQGNHSCAPCAVHLEWYGGGKNRAGNPVLFPVSPLAPAKSPRPSHLVASAQ